MSSSEQSIKEYLPILSMGGLILIVQILALFLSPSMEGNGMQAFEDPTQVSNSIYYIVMILGFTLLVLIALKKNMKRIISLSIYLAVISTLYYRSFRSGSCCSCTEVFDALSVDKSITSNIQRNGTS